MSRRCPASPSTKSRSSPPPARIALKAVPKKLLVVGARRDRAGTGLGVEAAGQRGDCGGIPRPHHPGHRPGSVQGLSAHSHQAGHHLPAFHQGHRRGEKRRRPGRHGRAGGGRREERDRSRCDAGRHRAAALHRRSGPGQGRRGAGQARPRHHRQSLPDQCAGHLCHRRLPRRPDAGAQGRRRSRGLRRTDRGQGRAM